MLNRVFISPVDCDFLPAPERERYHAEALRRLLADCADHPLLRARREQGTQRLEAIKVGDSEDHGLAIYGTAAYAAHVRRDPNSRIVFSTSGSSGRSRLLMTSYAEIINNARHHGKGYAVCGIGPQDRTVSFGEVGRFAAEFAVIAALDMTGCTIIPIVDRMRIAENAALFADMRVTVLLAMPSELLAYLDHWEASVAPLPPVRLVVSGGEPMPRGIERRLKALFGNALLLRSTFQTADTGTIGYQCTDCAANEFHLHEELQYVEVLDALGRPSDVGELVVSNLYRREMPVVRVRTGDRVAWANIERRCACGRHSRKIRLLGRSERMLKIGGEKLAADRLMHLGARMAPGGELVQFVLDRGPCGGDRLTAYCRAFAHPETAARARRELCAEPLLAALRDQGRLAGLKIAAAPPHGFDDPKFKPRLVIDARDASYSELTEEPA